MDTPVSARFILIRIKHSKWPAIIGVFACVLFILYFFPAHLIFSKGKTTYHFTKVDLPHEHEEVDPNDCKAKNVKELMKGPMNPVDRRLIRVVKKFYLEPPSEEPYNFADEFEGGPYAGLSDIVLELLDSQRDGFFIESRVKLADKYNGKFESNTLYLEKEYGWKGVLIEPDKEVYKLLKSKNRKAWTVNAMLSPNIYPQLVGFLPELEEETEYVGNKKMEVMIVQSFPIVTLIAALKERTVDYFSLSAQGSEFQILSTIPYEKIKFKLITIEHVWNNGVSEPIKTLLQGHGFIFVSSIIAGKRETSIYAHPSLFE